MRIAEFSFDTLVYEGASTLVYGGFRDSDGAPVVAKLVTDARRNLTHEHLVLQKVVGPGVVAALGLFEGSDGPVLVEHRYGSGNLADALRKGRFPISRALEVALQLARACAHVHAARIVHRDIKPANLLYEPATGAITLCDFGTAAELPVNARALPVGDLVGTPAYISPEHTGRTSEGCDARSDLYSLGITLYELLTGELPFADRDLLEVTAAHLSRMPEPPHQRLAAIPPLVSDIVMRLLAKLPDERYQSARGLVVDLERCLATLAPDGGIPGFQLGGSDLQRLRWPPRLFGRGGEAAVLEQALARAATGAPTLVLISGREGSGRTELVRALIRDTALASPLALGGWSSANEPPLSGLRDAFAALAHRLLRLDDDYVAALRRRLGARLGQIGQVVVDIAPPLGDVFGPQQALLKLGASATRDRLQHAVRSLAGALGDEAPFVLALRGFERADPSTLNLVEAVLDSPTSGRTLIVLIAQDSAAFAKLRPRPEAVSIALGPLPVAAMTEWIAATLGCEPGCAAELGETLHGKVAGNPLMLMRLLEYLVESRILQRRDGHYTWSIDAVRAAPPPATLGTLAAQRIAELDDDARRALAATVCGDEPIHAPALAATLAVDAGTASRHLAALEREGLVTGSPAGHRAAHPVIAETALAVVTADEVARMRGRLGSHLLAASAPTPTGSAALRIAMVLSRGTVVLDGADRARVAEIYVIAGEYVMASIAHDAAVAWFAAAGALLGDDAWQSHRALQFRIDLGRARVLVMLGRNRDADAVFETLIRRDLSPVEIGETYATRCDSYASLMDLTRALDTGIEGLGRLGISLASHPPEVEPLAAIRQMQDVLGPLTAEDHIDRPEATDDGAIAAAKILSAATIPALFLQRTGLHVLMIETGLRLVVEHGHLRPTVGLLVTHACFLHTKLGDYTAARRIYEAGQALDAARPTPEFVARNQIGFHYLLSPWFGPWQDSAAKLQRAMRLGVEAGDPVGAAYCASASITLLNLIGTPFDRMVAAIEEWRPFLRGDRGAAANAANIVNLAGKLARGEPVLPEDLDRVTNLPLAAGPMRNNAMVNLGLALTIVGHEAQVRAWLDEIRDSFPLVNWSQPHLMTLWLLDGLFAAKDARLGKPERRRDAERILDTFRTLRARTGATNNDPAIAVIEAQLARADGDVDRAAGLFGRAAHAARARELTPLVAYANEERAGMLDEAGYPHEAALYYREAVIGYRAWAHLTKVIELEQAHPELRARDLARVTKLPTADGQSLNDQMDLVTVLKVSQDISTQLHGSGVVRAVLTGIAENAGAERAVFVLCTATGLETVYGEVEGGVYRDIGVALDDYAALPKSVVRVVRRTGRPLVVADATGDPTHAADPFIVKSHGRSIACVPIRRSAEISGFIVLENRLVAGAFTPQLVSLAQALVAQATISLDNATLYADLSTLNRDLEARVEERTRALIAAQQQLVEAARKAGMADVAVEVLHNVGNTLNSVNVSAQQIEGQIAGSKTKTLARIATLLDEHKHDLIAFFTRDPRGMKVAEMVSMLGGALTREQETILGELLHLRTHIDSIIAVIHELHSTSADKGTAILEAPHVVLDEAVATVRDRAREHIAVSADCHVLPGAKVDKHKGLNILTRLLANAIDAVQSAPVEDKRIQVSVREAHGAVVFQVIDNGIGIPTENLPRIFHAGFNDKSDRRGDNLHKSANSATSAGGSLTVESEGLGRGATFTLVLPNRREDPGRG